MRPLLLAASLLVASGAMAQNPPGPPPPPDTTSSWRYVPLAIGDAWEYAKLSGDIAGGRPSTVTRLVRSDTLVEGVVHRLIEEKEFDETRPSERPTVRRFAARFDTLASALYWSDVLSGAAPCALNVPFPRTSEDIWLEECGDAGTVAISGGYEETVELGASTYTRTVKTMGGFLVVGASVSFAADLGMVAFSIEESPETRWTLRGARINGEVFGDPSRDQFDPSRDRFPGIPDPTDPSRYYPLAVGDVWQYKLCGRLLVDDICNGQDDILLREAIDVAVMGDTSYTVVRQKVFTRNSEQEQYVYVSQSQELQRFDRATAMVHTRGELVGGAIGCPLDADFGAVIQGESCYGAYVEGQSGIEPVKGFGFQERGLGYKADVGYVGSESQYFSETLVYSRVGGVERGTLVPVVDVAGEAEPLAPALALDAFPNPTAGPLAVTLRQRQTGTVRLEAFDALGRRVFSREVAPEARIELDASAWAPGLYVLRATSGDEVATTQVVKR